MKVERHWLSVIPHTLVDTWFMFWCGKQNDRPYVSLAMPFNLFLSIYPVFLMAMPVNMILVMYVILCILPYDFNKLTMLYIHVHISISMTSKSGLTFFLSIKYLSVCLVDTWFMQDCLIGNNPLNAKLLNWIKLWPDWQLHLFIASARHKFRCLKIAI